MTNISYMPFPRGLIFSVIHGAPAVSKTKSPAPLVRQKAGLETSPCQYIRGQATLVWAALLCGGGQILSGGLAGLLVTNDLIREFLSLAEIRDASLFEGADVDKYVLAAIIRLDEAEALDAVKPLYGSPVHGSPFCRYELCVGDAQTLPVEIEFGMEVVRQARFRGEASSFGRNSMFVLHKQL
jgi:hypothetical protein